MYKRLYGNSLSELKKLSNETYLLWRDSSERLIIHYAPSQGWISREQVLNISLYMILFSLLTFLSDSFAALLVKPIKSYSSVLMSPWPTSSASQVMQNPTNSSKLQSIYFTTNMHIFSRNCYLFKSNRIVCERVYEYIVHCTTDSFSGPPCGCQNN